MLDGSFVPSQEEQLPALSDVDAFYREKLERVSDPPTPASMDTPAGDYSIANQALTPLEVQEALKGMKRASATGPDGWQTNTVLKKVPADSLAAVLNVFLWLAWVPTELKESRSILIPKGSCNGPTAKKVGSFRPLSITPALSRLYARCVSKRL